VLRQQGEDARLKVTFFAGSVVGYYENPAALLTRGLAHGLALRGNDVRIVEERQNPAFSRTLRAVGAEAVRHFHQAFPLMQHHTYDPRTGAPLLEWVTREIALLDLAVVVDDVGDELCRWLANVSRRDLTRAYLAWDPGLLTSERVSYLELERFDLLLAPTAAETVSIPWRSVTPALAQRDIEAGLHDHLPLGLTLTADPVEAAASFERAVKSTVVS
jgi:hypothetical protein